jgi:hypothetical protein
VFAKETHQETVNTKTLNHIKSENEKHRLEVDQYEKSKRNGELAL